MPFNSFLFLLAFLPFVLAGYAGACRLGASWAKAWLIVASLLFYGVWARHFLPLLLTSVIGNLLLLQAMRFRAPRGPLAALGVTLNLVVLGWFKYAAPGIWPDPVLPLGISFFTFTQIGCLLAQAASDEPPPRAQDYALFVLFFPALTAGPILNAREMLPQFARTQGWRLSSGDLAIGSGFFLVGLLKKTLLADPLSGIVSAGFADPGSLSLLPAWHTAAAWSLQLYFDFSGYTDMAIGLAWMFGFRFPDNFEQPYRAQSVIAYWQRWHMTLTRFLVTNVHAPLTLSILRWRRRRGLPINQAAQRGVVGFMTMIAAPIFLTMVLVGVWHGPSLTFLLFGVLHAGLLLINHAWRLWRAPSLPPLANVALTYLSVLVGAILFRANSVADAGSLLAGMAAWHGLGGQSQHGYGLGQSMFAAFDIHVAADLLWIVALYAVVWLAPSTRQLMQDRDAAAGQIEEGASAPLVWQPSPRWAVAMGCAATLGLLASGGTGEFVYFHF